MNSGEIRTEIDALFKAYTIAVSDETKTLDDRHLMQLARSSSSSWSGGHSAHNALEQIVRQIAIDRLDRRMMDEWIRKG